MSFNSFQEKLLDFLSEDPNFCVYQGMDKNLGQLPDPGKNKRITNQGKLKMLVKTLSRIEKDTLGFDDQINYELCELLLEQQRLSYELDLGGAPHNMRMPKASEIISGPIFMLFINDPRDAKLRLVNIISRLEKVDAFIISYNRNIVEPVERWVKVEQQSLAGLPELFENIISWAKGIEFKNTERLEKAVQSANTALKKYENFLNICSTSKDIFIGNEQMNTILKSRGIELSSDELLKVSKDFIKRNRDEVDELRVLLIKKYNLSEDTTSDEMQLFLNEKFKVKRDTDDYSFILNRYEAEREKLLSYIKEKDLFPVMEDQEMQIIQTPDFMMPTIPAGAMMPPSPMREGVKKSMVYLSLSDELLAEHTEISIPGMMIHEGIPGHHLQYAWTATNKNLIRKIMNASDLSEGWATMLEEYMLNIGYGGELENEIRFSGKRDIARIGVRIAIDLYFMSGDKKFLDVNVDCDLSSDDPFICAGNLLKEVTGFVDERVIGELNFYSQERGYPLCYLAGNHLVWKLKEKFIERYKNDLSEVEIDREFHKRFLEAGNMPVSILERVILK